MKYVDLATELGESFALPPAGVPMDFLSQHEIGGRRLHPRHLIQRDDRELLDVISTGYVACGAHSGDSIVMARTVRVLADRGLAIGAHPSYPDIVGFGQLPLDVQDDELESIILTQIAGLSALAERAGTKISSVKCHGALSFDVAYDERIAQVMAMTIRRFDPSIALVCMAGSPGVRVARDCGIPVVQEAYIDRGYDATGRIVDRRRPDALITDAATAVNQFLSVFEMGQVNTVEGEAIPLKADSFCLHSDTPNSKDICRMLVDAMKERNVQARAPST